MPKALALLLLVGGACAAGPEILARGTLAYDVAVGVGGAVVASIELTDAFALVLRRGTTVTRTRLGPPELDFVAVAADGATVAVAGLDGTVRVFDAKGGETRRFRLDDAATAVALIGPYLVHGSASGILCLRRLEDGALLQCVDAHDGRVSALARDEDSVVSGGADGAVIVWSVPSLAVRARHRAHAAVTALAARRGQVAVASERTPTVALAFLPDGRLVRLGKDGSIRAGDRIIGRSQLPLRRLAVSPDGHIVYVAAFTGTDLAGASIQAFSLP